MKKGARTLKISNIQSGRLQTISIDNKQQTDTLGLLARGDDGGNAVAKLSIFMQRLLYTISEV